MEKLIFNNHRHNIRILGLSLLCIILLTVMNLTFTNGVQAQSYKQNTGYLLQKVEPFTHVYYIPYKHGLTLPCFYGYYVADEETLQNYFKHDTVIIEQAIMLCDPLNVMFTDSAVTKEVKHFTRIKDILLLDDSEIYEIGHEKYIIRKIRYAYYDNTQVKVYIMSGAADIAWDDIQDEDTAEYNKIYDVGQYYEREYYQCYHHLIEILPTPPQISKHIWRRLYQLGEEINEESNKIWQFGSPSNRQNLRLEW